MKKSVSQYPASLFLIAVILFFSSCRTTYTYTENVVNVPSLEEKGEVQVAGYLSWNHVEAQTAYAINNKLGIMLNGFLSHSKFNDDGKRSFIEGGIGYQKQIKEWNYWEVYSGYGYAKQSAANIWADEIAGYYKKHPIYYGDADFTGRYSVEGNYHRVFIQPSYLLKYDFAEIDFTLRNSFVYYPRYDFKYRYGQLDGGHLIVQHADTLNIKNLMRVLIEPALTLKLRAPGVNFISQTGLVIHAHPYRSNKIFHPVTPTAFLTFGIQLDLKPSLFRKKKKEIQ